MEEMCSCSGPVRFCWVFARRNASKKTRTKAEHQMHDSDGNESGSRAGTGARIRHLPSTCLPLQDPRRADLEPVPDT